MTASATPLRRPRQRSRLTAFMVCGACGADLSALFAPPAKKVQAELCCESINVARREAGEAHP